MSPGVSRDVQAELTDGTAEKLVVENVWKRFDSGGRTITALENVSLRVDEGEFVCLVGPSGCGKSTLLNIVAGLEMPDEGSIAADGKAVTGPARERMMLFQEPGLFPWLDVLGNVVFGLRFKPNLKPHARVEVARYYLQLVGLGAFERARIHQLSGGMRQRVALARALAPNPRMLLMDEPFAALDAMTREQLYVDLQRIWQERKKTILFVTHNVREAACLGDRIVVCAADPGRLAEEFEVDIPRPREINDPDVARQAAVVTASLKRHAVPCAGPRA